MGVKKMRPVSVSLGKIFLFLLNIIIGTGVYLNSIPLYNLLGKYSFLAYLCTGILVFPIIYIAYEITVFFSGKNLSDIFFEHFSSLSYFPVLLYVFSKLGTSVIGVIFLTQSLLSFFDFSAYVNSLWPIIILFLFCYFFVYYDFVISLFLQRMIMFAKLIPLFIMVLFSFYIFFCKSHMGVFVSDVGSLDIFSLNKLCSSIGITLFAFSGFESLFSLSDSLQKRDNKISLVLLFAFFFSLILYVLYQYCLAYIGFFTLNMPGGENNFFIFLKKITNSLFLGNFFFFFSNLAIFFSAFGVSQGVLYAGIRNIVSLWERLSSQKVSIDTHIVKKILFFIFLLYLYIGSRNIFILQQLSSLGTIITYFLLVIIYQSIPGSNRLFSFCSLLSVLLLFIFHFYNAWYNFGFYGYFFYLIIFLLLIILFFILKKYDTIKK
jgi:hypothetical protein